MNILVIGRRGEGKSTLSLFLARRIQNARNAHTIPIFDPKRTFNSVPHTADIGEFEELLETNSDAVAYQPYASTSDERKSGDEVASEFSTFFDAIGIDYHFGLRDTASRENLGAVILIVDEAWFIQAGQSAHPKLERIVRLADSKNFYLIQAAHRPKDFATRIRAQVDEFYFFRQWLAEDLEIIREWCGEDVARIVETLPPHHVLRYDVATREFSLWNDPKAWYSDLSAEAQCPKTTKS